MSDPNEIRFPKYRYKCVASMLTVNELGMLGWHLHTVHDGWYFMELEVWE